MIDAEPIGILVELRQAFLRAEFSGRRQRRSRLIVFVLRRVPKHVARLVVAVSLHGIVRAEHFVDCLAKRFSAVDHEQPPSARRHAPLDEFDKQRLDHFDALGGSFAQTENVLFPSASTPTAATTR